MTKALGLTKYKIEVIESRRAVVVVTGKDREDACRNARLRVAFTHGVRPMTEVRCRVLDKDA